MISPFFSLFLRCCVVFSTTSGPHSSCTHFPPLSLGAFNFGNLSSRAAASFFLQNKVASLFGSAFDSSVPPPPQLNTSPRGEGLFFFFFRSPFFRGTHSHLSRVSTSPPPSCYPPQAGWIASFLSVDFRPPRPDSSNMSFPRRRAVRVFPSKQASVLRALPRL